MSHGLTLASQWAGVLAGGMTVGGGVLVVFKKWILADIKNDTRQLTTNGGSHMADAVNRIEAKVDKIDEKTDQHGERLARLEGAAGIDVRVTA